MPAETLLIVDDEPVNLSALNSILSETYQVRAATSGPQALKVARSDPRPDLVLLDVLMPGMDGYQVLTALKSDPVTRHIPVIFVTARDSSEDEREGLSLGAVDYISKPVNPPILLARVHNHLLLKKTRDRLNRENDYLEMEVARRVAEKEIVQSAAIRALAHLAETRDTETGDHIIRTQQHVHALASHLRDHPRYRVSVTDGLIDLMTQSAPLHDIGKVGIPDHILLKPGALNEDEWNIMKTHAALGAQALERAEADVAHPVEFLTVAKEIAHWHHERWDGSGYPDGIAGEDIPLPARIMAVADVFDSLVSKRVYKDPFSLDAARRLIREGAGTQFDPDIAEVFDTHFEDFAAIARGQGNGLIVSSPDGTWGGGRLAG